MGVCLATAQTQNGQQNGTFDASSLQKPLPILREELFDTLFYPSRKILAEKRNKVEKFVTQKAVLNDKSLLLQETNFSPPRLRIPNSNGNNSDELIQKPSKIAFQTNNRDFCKDSISRLNFQELYEEHFKIFCTYRFYNSHTKAMLMRQEEVEQLNKEKKMREDEDFLFVTNITMPRSHLKGSSSGFGRTQTEKQALDQQNVTQQTGQYNWIRRNNNYNEDEVDEQNLQEENMVVATWINDMGQNHNEFEDKILFFNNETILLNKTRYFHHDQGGQRTSLLEHFQNPLEHRRVLAETNIEFQCKKGGGYDSLNTKCYLPKKQNQDNFFIVADAELKIFGVFDGHGQFGHLVSGFASGIMLDYIRNKDKALRHRYLFKEDDSFDNDIRRALRRCFKYTQERLKVIQKAYQQEKKLYKKASKLEAQTLRLSLVKLQLSGVELNENLCSAEGESMPIQTQIEDPLSEEEFDKDVESLCTESSWDPNEEDPNEIVEESEEIVPQPKKTKNNQKIMTKINGSPSSKNKGIAQKLSEVESFDSYGDDEDQLSQQDEEESKGYSESEDNDDLFFDSDDPDMSNQEDDVEAMKYLREVRKIEQKNKDLATPQQKRDSQQEESNNTSSSKLNRKIIKVISNEKRRKGTLNQTQEQILMEKIRKMSEQELLDFDINLSGCSATLVFQTSMKIYIAWVGDCHALLCKKERKLVNIKLTQDRIIHTPSDQKELERIYHSKGEVRTGITLSGDKKPRIYVRGRTYPALSTTRSLGDLMAHHIGVTSEPSVRIIKLSKQQTERFIAVGTDGIWDNVAPEDLSEYVNEHGMKEIGTGSEYVVQKARDLSISEQVPLDDITLVISHLKREDKF